MSLYIVYLRGKNVGEHKSRALAEKRVSRLVAMSNGRLSKADFKIVDTKSNPVSIRVPQKDLKKAVRLFKEFRERAPSKVRTVKVKVPKALMVMGHLDFVGYTTTHGGKTVAYKHTFAAGSKPLICAAPGKNQLFLIGGRYRVTDRGIVDLDTKNREIDD